MPRHPVRDIAPDLPKVRVLLFFGCILVPYVLYAAEACASLHGQRVLAPDPLSSRCMLVFYRCVPMTYHRKCVLFLMASCPSNRDFRL